MLPTDLSTVMMPSATFQRAGEWSLVETHWSRLRPSNSTIASDGGALLVAPGDTTEGTGSHCSVAFGSAFASLAFASLAVAAGVAAAVGVVAVGVGVCAAAHIAPAMPNRAATA